MTKLNTLIRMLAGLAAILAFAWVAGCSSGNDVPFDPFQPNNNDKLESGNLFVLEHEMSAQGVDEGLSVMIPIHLKTDDDLDAEISVSLVNLSDEVIATRKIDLKLTEKVQDSEVIIDGLDDEFFQQDKAGYLVRFAIEWDDGKVWGTRSLHVLYRYVQAQLLGAENLFENGKSFYKLIISEPNSGAPVENASATFYIMEGENAHQVGSGSTDAFGMADVQVDLPVDVIGDAQLKVEIEMPGGEQQEQAIAPVKVAREAKVLLTTDKPLYQPGQTIHMRALALKRPDLLPQSDLPVVFTVIDPKGNKVFKNEQTSSEYGVAATTFKLASLLNEGKYTIQAEVGAFVTEKTLPVERYALPKFNVVFSTNRDFYRPGQKLAGSVKAEYFFGKTVAGGSVNVVASKFDIELEEFANITGTLDENGEYDFEVDLPSYFVASALDQNKAYAIFEITVTDTAGHAQIKTSQALVVENAILLAMVPESGSLVPGVANQFYLMATDPFGRPLDVDCTVTAGGVDTDLSTGGWGLTIFEHTPAEESIQIRAKCDGDNGDSVQDNFDFAAETNREYVLVRTDSSLYKVGDTIELTVFATNDGWDAAHLPDRVYLDVIKNGQTLLMTIISLNEGTGTYALDIDPGFSGSIELMAYYLGAAGEIIRDRRLVFVELANSLTVEITPNKDTFLPAEEASISLAVRDSEGTGVQSVLGVQVVDEAVFALQEMKPGMEKIYFELEEELLEPRYEIHGFDAADIMDPMPEDPDEAAEREARTGAFLASAGTDAAYGTHINTFAGVDETAQATAETRVKDDLSELIDHINWMTDSGFITGEQGVKAWVEQRNSDENPLYDAWGQGYVLEYKDSELRLSSAGMDEKRGNQDDILVNEYLYVSQGRDDWDDDAALDGGAADGEAPPGDEGFGNDDKQDEEPNAADGDDPAHSGDDGEEGDGPRVRSYFPETLYVNPAVITDDGGEAEVNFTMADSITSWRMTALASSLAGQIGSNVGNVIVFQDFFVDIDFPATLTQNDEVAVPIAIYNYLGEQQTIELTAEAGDWVQFMEGQTRQVTVGPNSVTGLYFPVRVIKVGRHNFTVTAIGTAMSDAIRRSVEVTPDGLEVRNAASGRLDGEQNLTLNVPAEAIADASKMWVKIYPGLFSQVVEGLDSMLQMPSGCFEQTSSSTYPNILVLDYLVLTGMTTPEVELKARDYISQGYQRLLSYEVDGGGFEWFGSPPAHRALTAYGLLEFFDMSKVHDVDDAVITRTQNWLASLQNGDGSFDFDAGGIHEGATNNFKSSVLRTTAYIAYALAESGDTSGAVDTAVQYVKQHLSEANDNYSLAMIAMLLSTAAPDDPKLTQVLDDLYDARIEDEDGKIHWGQEDATEMYGQGNSAELETTSLVGQALIRGNQHMNIIPNIMDWLISKKGSFGEWSTTQGTIQALRFMIASLGAQVEESNATITVTANGREAAVLTVDAFNSDVLQLVDLTTDILDGDNKVDLAISGEGNLMYSAVTSHWLPSEDNPYENDGPLSIAIEYDKTTLEVDDIVTATVTITNNIDAVSRMILVDIGMPPGFDLIPDMLNEQISSTELQKFEVAGRQLILYIERIEPNSDLVLTYQLRARFPMEGSSGSASVSNYYEPENESTTGPVAFTVTE